MSVVAAVGVAVCSTFGVIGVVDVVFRLFLLYNMAFTGLLSVSLWSKSVICLSV